MSKIGSITVKRPVHRFVWMCMGGSTDFWCSIPFFNFYVKWYENEVLNKKSNKKKKNLRNKSSISLKQFISSVFHILFIKELKVLIHLCGNRIPREGVCEFTFLSEGCFEAEFEDFFSVANYWYFLFSSESLKLITYSFVSAIKELTFFR